MLDEVNPEATSLGARSAEPYRRNIIGLPLQRSLFDLAAQAGVTIGLPGLTSEKHFPARLDENGDLLLDRVQVAALSDALPSYLTFVNLEAMYSTHAAACDALVKASENAARIAGSGRGMADQLIEDLANRMALVLAYGILSKFVPDVLLNQLAKAGDPEPPPFPERSAGAELMQDMFALCQRCYSLGYNPERLMKEWPQVAPEVFAVVNAFCRRQTGFGPLAWDSPGYEDPTYVVRLLHSAFNQIDAEKTRERLSFRKNRPLVRPASSSPGKFAALRRVLGFWLVFLERETWYARRSFYVGMVPLLRQFAAAYRKTLPELQVADLLFLNLPELIAGAADPALIRLRRHRYRQNEEYLSLHGVDESRFGAIVTKA